MKSTIILPAIFLAVTFSGPAAYGLESSAFVMEAADAAQTNTQYAEGTRAINDGRWTDAEAIFTKIAAEHGDRADAATYWKAYAENKEGKADRAIETCATLRHSHADSRYISDCDALRVEIQGSAFRVEVPPIPPVAPVVVPHIEVSPSVHVETHITGRPPQTPSNPDEDLKLLALQAVMQQDESRALPIIQQILKGNGSEGLKQRALFVLAQSNTPQAKQTLGQIARDSSNPGLQLRAIKIYAAMGGKGSVDTLSDIYQHSSDKNVKRAILQSYLITGSSDKLLAAARSEQDPELVRSAVRSLGAMSATSDLSTLYRDSKDQRVKADIINALVAAGPKGVENLKTIVATEQDPELRRRAIRNLGVSGGASAAPSLVSAYQNSPDVESKRAALDGLFISGDAHDLVALARTEKNPELKQNIVSKLGTMHNKEATDYMMEILSK